jgi:hypothetical protein
MRRFILFLSFAGTVLFGGVLALSFLEPVWIERAAREVVRMEVERRIGEKIDDLSGSRLASLARGVLQRTEVDIQSAELAIRQDVPRKVSEVLAGMLDADCACRQRLVEHARRSEAHRLSSLLDVRARLVDLIESAYASVTNDLMRELRIFTASNATAFALLGLVTLLRRRAALQLVLPALVLVGAVAVTASLYLFNQNWLHTIVFGDYVGLAYAAYLSIVALLLADIVLNRARVTTRIVNTLLESMGSAVSAVPC